MKQIKIKTGKATLVVVENAETIFKGISVGDHITFNKNVFPLLPDELHNEDDIYEIIGRPNDLYEEDWEEIVEPSSKYSDFYKSYDVKNTAAFAYATESGITLLRLNGIDDSWLNPQIFIKV